MIAFSFDEAMFLSKRSESLPADLQMEKAQKQP